MTIITYSNGYYRTVNTTPNAADMAVTLIEGSAQWIMDNDGKSAYTYYERITELARVFEDGSDAAVSMALNSRSDVIQINCNELHAMCQDAARELRHAARQAKNLGTNVIVGMLYQTAANIAHAYGGKRDE